MLNTVDEGIEAVRQGKIVIVVGELLTLLTS